MAHEEARKIPEAYLKGLAIDPNRIGAQAQKLLNHIYDSMDEGFTPLEKIQKVHERTAEIFNKIKPEGFIGPLLKDEAQMTPEMRRALNENEYASFIKEAGNQKTRGQSLTGAFYAGSAGATDIINKAQLDQANSTQDEIKAAVENALIEQKEHNRLLQVFTDMVEQKLIPALPVAGGG